jgi:hypothetical protein
MASLFAAGIRRGHPMAQRAIREKVGMTWAFRDLAAFNGDAGNIPAAREALAKFVAARPDVTISRLRDSLRFIEAKTLDRYLGGLRVAGLRE